MQFDRANANPKLVVTALALVVALAGCGGGSTSLAERAFGGGSADDPATAQAVLDDMDAVAVADRAFVTAIEGSDYPAARAAIETLRAHTERAQEHAQELDGPSEGITTLQGYVAAVPALIRASDRRLAYFEDDQTAADARRASDLQTRYDEAMNALLGADRELRYLLLDNASPDERQAIRDEYHRAGS